MKRLDVIMGFKLFSDKAGIVKILSENLTQIVLSVTLSDDTTSKTWMFIHS